MSTDVEAGLGRAIPLDTVRERLDQLVEDVRDIGCSYEPVIITRDDSPIAVLLDFGEWEALEAVRDAVDVAVARARRSDGSPDVPLTEALRQPGAAPFRHPTATPSHHDAPRLPAPGG